jgi:hypothetical protein
MRRRIGKSTGMQIVYHLGVHCTDEERLLRCLLKNRALLAEDGILVPGPARYRTLLRDTAKTLKGQPAGAETQSLVLDEIIGNDSARRLVFSWDNFPGYPQGAVRSAFYASAAERMRGFCQIFPEAETEFHLAIRNPATFIPAIYQKQGGLAFEEFMDGVDPLTLRWSDLIASLQAANPDVEITVWCDEDTPLIWPEVLQAVSDHGADVMLEDSDDLLRTIMSPDGLQRMTAYMATHPPQSPGQRRRIVSAFLDKFAIPDRIEVEFDMPGWTEDLIAAASAAYDMDVSRIMAMPGVRFIAA